MCRYGNFNLKNKFLENKYFKLLRDSKTNLNLNYYFCNRFYPYFKDFVNLISDFEFSILVFEDINNILNQIWPVCVEIRLNYGDLNQNWKNVGLSKKWNYFFRV